MSWQCFVLVLTGFYIKRVVSLKFATCTNYILSVNISAFTAVMSQLFLLLFIIMIDICIINLTVLRVWYQWCSFLFIQSFAHIPTKRNEQSTYPLISRSSINILKFNFLPFKLRNSQKYYSIIAAMQLHSHGLYATIGR